MEAGFDKLIDRETKDCSVHSKRLLERAIATITQNVPEFGYVFETLCFEETERDIKISTDGKKLIYNPRNVTLTRQKMGLSQIQEQLLHVILHYLRGDILNYRQVAHKELFGAIADTKVHEILSALKRGDGSYNAKNMKDYYMAKYDRELAAKLISQAREKCKSDDHTLWLDQKKDIRSLIADLEKNLEKVFGKEASYRILVGTASLENELMDRFGSKLMAAISKCAGTHSGNEETEYAPHKSSSDYKKVIESLLTESIVEQESLESLDRHLYCYGLDMYGDVPLVEPGEDETVQRQVKGRLVLAVDTSGSCQGELVSRFLGELGKLFFQIQDDSEMSDLEVRYIECDCDIAAERIYRNEEIGRAFSRKRDIRGGGGTSFIPVFDRLEKLDKESSRPLTGLIYFTDGYGRFPDFPPKVNCPIIFVLPKDSYGVNAPDLPSYVQKTYFK